jgi:hypothetical protein
MEGRVCQLVLFVLRLQSRRIKSFVVFVNAITGVHGLFTFTIRMPKKTTVMFAPAITRICAAEAEQECDLVSGCFFLLQTIIPVAFRYLSTWKQINKYITSSRLCDRGDCIETRRGMCVACPVASPVE